ncbi:MAG: hypothetical protein M3Y75_11550 [Actinomycetota bacterium]|nr:hypothetical protein [Actinomycetota bacterium]
MAEKLTRPQSLPPAARVFSGLQVEEALMPAEVSASRRAGALMLAFLVLVATPLFFAANAAGLIGDAPAALAKSGSSSPGADEDDRLGPGDDEIDDITFLKTDNTSANNRETRGTTRDGDTTTRTRGGTNDTSRNGNSTRGTTRDNDTGTNTRNSATGTQTPTNTND